MTQGLRSIRTVSIIATNLLFVQMTVTHGRPGQCGIQVKGDILNVISNDNLGHNVYLKESLGISVIIQ